MTWTATNTYHVHLPVAATLISNILRLLLSKSQAALQCCDTQTHLSDWRVFLSDRSVFKASHSCPFFSRVWRSHTIVTWICQCCITSTKGGGLTFLNRTSFSGHLHTVVCIKKLHSDCRRRGMILTSHITHTDAASENTAPQQFSITPHSQSPILQWWLQITKAGWQLPDLHYLSVHVNIQSVVRLNSINTGFIFTR